MNEIERTETIKLFNVLQISACVEWFSSTVMFSASDLASHSKTHVHSLLSCRGAGFPVPGKEDFVNNSQKELSKTKFL